MSYRPINLERFKWELQSGRYRTLSNAKTAVTAARWGASIKSEALKAAEAYFAEQRSVEGGAPHPDFAPLITSDVRQTAVPGLVLALEALSTADPAFVERARKALQAVLAPRTNAVVARTPQPHRVIPFQRPDPPSEAPSKPDLSDLFNDPAEGEEDDEEAHPDARRVDPKRAPVLGSDSLEAALPPTPRPDIEDDIEKRLAALEASEAPEKEKKKGRELARDVLAAQAKRKG